MAPGDPAPKEPAAKQERETSLDSLEQNRNNVRLPFRQILSIGEVVMFRAVVEEAAALASISLFLGMIAVWAQVFSVL